MTKMEGTRKESTMKEETKKKGTKYKMVNNVNYMKIHLPDRKSVV